MNIETNQHGFGHPLVAREHRILTPEQLLKCDAFYFHKGDTGHTPMCWLIESKIKDRDVWCWHLHFEHIEDDAVHMEHLLLRLKHISAQNPHIETWRLRHPVSGNIIMQDIL